MLANFGVSANQITLLAAISSIVASVIILACASVDRKIFILLPCIFFVRMALNAIDGMLAREFNMKTKLGGMLNEVCDVISDAALYLSFIGIADISYFVVMGAIFLSILSEYIGVVGQVLSGVRGYEGPMGKSDRAFAFGLLGLIIAFVPLKPQWINSYILFVAILIIITCFNRLIKSLAR